MKPIPYRKRKNDIRFEILDYSKHNYNTNRIPNGIVSHPCNSDWKKRGNDNTKIGYERKYRCNKTKENSMRNTNDKQTDTVEYSNNDVNNQHPFDEVVVLMNAFL